MSTEVRPVVERAIRIPRRASGRPRGTSRWLFLPFDDMQPGDSFHVPGRVDPDAVHCSFSRWRKRERGRSGYRLTVRSEGLGHRFWLVERAPSADER